MYHIRLTKHAVKDYELIKAAKLSVTVRNLLEIMKQNPFQSPPPFEKLIGDLAGAYSRRINLQHRLVYRIEPELKEIMVIKMWTHYE
jgi:toxin-antitoxin system, toxin component, Txe/YoeB family